MACVDITSRPSVGSSRRSTGGSWIKALARASFCLMPREYFAVLSFRLS